MIFLKRKRLIFWLLRAYLKKWGKSIALSFGLGLVIILLLFVSRNFFLSKIPITNTQTIGLAGIYSRQDFPNSLPEVVQDQISRGLTKVDDSGKVLPDIASRWDIKDKGKTYVFYIKPNVYFSDGKPLDSASIEYNFEDVTIERPARDVIVFKLKDRYSPFLVTLANHKIFKKNNIGISSYKINKINTNAEQIVSIDLYSKKDKKIIKYIFKDTQEALKNAYVLGEVSEIVDINSLNYDKKYNLSKFKNTVVNKNLNKNKIVTVFINTDDPLLSDKKIRKALAYSLPDKFINGERVYTPYKPGFWANNSAETYKKDIAYSKELLSGSDASKSATINITLKTLPQYKELADTIAKNWKEIGINTKIEIVDLVPNPYQAFIGELPVLKDPDQYTFWHTGQTNNITNYKNLRIDKLLEDGRVTYSTTDRKNIYYDFQKYLVDDMPAIFLFVPYTYTLTRE